MFKFIEYLTHQLSLDITGLKGSLILVSSKRQPDFGVLKGNLILVVLKGLSRSVVKKIKGAIRSFPLWL